MSAFERLRNMLFDDDVNPEKAAAIMKLASEVGKEAELVTMNQAANIVEEHGSPELASILRG